MLWAEVNDNIIVYNIKRTQTYISFDFFFFITIHCNNTYCCMSNRRDYIKYQHVMEKKNENNKS